MQKKMLPKEICFLLVIAVAIFVPPAAATLNRNEKQALFDYHNYIRAQLGRNQIVTICCWS